MRLVVFDDVGFGSLTGSRPIGGSVAVLADVISRDGFIACHVALLGHRCAKIQRVCKSPMAAEGRATLTAAYQALWTQALLRDIATGAYNIEQVSPPSEFPLPDPFGQPPTDDEVKWRRQANNSKRHIFMSSCVSCQTSVSSGNINYGFFGATPEDPTIF